MITVLRGDRTGGKTDVLLRIPTELLNRAEELIRGERASGLVKLLEIGIESHIASGEDITIDVPRPIKAKPVPAVPEATAATPAPAAAIAPAVAPGSSNILAELDAATAGVGFGRTKKKG